MFKDGIRVVVRGVELPLLDPQTKQPVKGKTHIVWTAWVPEDQEPYAVSSRAKAKNWRPPVGYLPFPKEWADLTDRKLVNITKVKDAVFCHRGLFIIVAKSKGGAIKLTELALKS